MKKEFLFGLLNNLYTINFAKKSSCASYIGQESCIFKKVTT